MFLHFSFGESLQVRVRGHVVQHLRFGSSAAHPAEIEIVSRNALRLCVLFNMIVLTALSICCYILHAEI